MTINNRYQRATSWMANIKTVAIVSIAVYVIIWIVWLVVRVSLPSATPSGFWLKELYDETSPFTFAWSVIVGALYLIASSTNQRWEAARRLRESQKQRIRILNNFHPSSRMRELFDKRSIYDAVMGLLRRLKDEPEEMQGSPASGEIRYNVCMLLCSPALDYWANKESRSKDAELPQWGLEFRDVMEKLVARSDTEFHVCHLPVDPSSGVNALSNFISALATYTIQNEEQFKTGNEPGRSRLIAALAAQDDGVVVGADKDGTEAAFRGLVSLLRKRSKRVAADFEQWSTDDDKKKRFHLETHAINIPFQVVLVDSEDFMEVVVSFAGREVLERRQDREIKGFYSSDPYVVKTFRDVFETYVESRGRIPYIPEHTSKIADDHNVMGRHAIPSYYNGLVGPLYVLPETFSPVVGNSTKFTVWLLDKLLTTGKPGGPYHWGGRVKKILDVGSGTGILALATSAILRDRCGRNDFAITAIDSCPHALTVLKLNTANDHRIKVKPWTLHFKLIDKRTIGETCFRDEAGHGVPIEGDFAGFDLITADLPFVHAQKRRDSDLRFLDCDHHLHQAMFRLATSSKLLAEEGLLVTAFSSLGGTDDIAEFERYVLDSRLQIIQRVEFHESTYMWMVYVLMKKTGYDTYGEQLWWKVLDAQRHEPWTPTANVSAGAKG